VGPSSISGFQGKLACIAEVAIGEAVQKGKTQEVLGHYPTFTQQLVVATHRPVQMLGCYPTALIAVNTGKINVYSDGSRFVGC
jgi:hypothetical protein